MFSNTFLYQLAYSLQSQYQELGTHLGFCNSELSNIQSEHRGNPIEQGFTLLSTWRERVKSRPINAIVTDLKRALEAIHRPDFARLVSSRPAG